ncbi:PAS domain S-box protein [Adhaeribacter aquaticus]|uniref:PAS domain S-box protein n=1 Tax=Adhaeribacter aquaticus TaxID=299567 RepID=UPI00047B3100|nr:PAS domain S-box protein [Adhaeribacter aquaticus]
MITEYFSEQNGPGSAAGPAQDAAEQVVPGKRLEVSETSLAADLTGMRRLYELQSKLAQQTDVKVAFQEVLALACVFTGTDRGCVQFLSDDRKRMEMFVWQGYPDDSPFISFFRYEGLKNGCEVTRVQRQRLIIEETVGFEGLAGTDAGAATYADEIRAAQSTPMTSRSDETIGVISTQFRQPHRPSDHELRLMDMLAWTAAEFLERHRADAALRHSEERYRTLFETMDEAYAVIEMLFDTQNKPVDFRILECNPAFGKLTGLQNAAGKTARELVPEIEQFWIETHGQVALTGEPTRYSNRVAGLHDRWYDGYAFRLGGKESRQVAIVFSEITERKRTEEALRVAEEKHRTQLEQKVAQRTIELMESTALLQSVFDTSLIGMSVLKAVRDGNGEIQDFSIQLANKKLQRETNRPDLEGKHFAEEFPGIKQTEMFELMLRVVESGEPAGCEHPYRYEGLDKWYSSTLVKLDDGLVMTTLNITSRKQAEKELAKNHTLLRQAEQVSRMGSWEYDVATGGFDWSEGMYHLFNLPTGQPVRPQIYLDFVISEDLPKAEKIVKDIVKPLQSFEETIRISVDGQEVTLKIKAIVQENLSGGAEKVLGVDMDTSELKRLEQENLSMRLQQQQQLLKAILEAQEEESRRISESLHNGVGQILYAAKLSLARVDLDAPKAQEPAVAEALQKAESLLTEAIVETRKVSHELVPILLKEFGLQHAIEEFCKHFSVSGIKLDCHCFPDRLPDHLEKAIYRMGQELINNIVRHSGATQANLELSRDQEHIYLEARDNGKGMDWGSTEDGSQSRGIGIRTIQDRVKLLDGTVEVDSTPGKDTFITICLPAPDRASN